MEFRPMRRKRQELPKEECEKILNNATAGVLSVLGDGGYPYGVPMSFVYAEGKLYFHSAVEGHKLDAIAKEDKCSFTIIDQDEIHPDKYTSYFRSVIAFGRIQRLEGMEELIHGLRLLGEKYNPGDHAGLQHEIDKSVAMPGGIPDDGWDWPLWKWKGIIINESDCVYGKFFNGKAGFISRSWWTHFCNWRRSIYPMPENGSIEGIIYEDGTPEQIFEHPVHSATKAFVNRIQKLVYEIDSDDFDYLQIHTGLNQFCLKYNITEKADRAYSLVKEILFTHMPSFRPLTLRLTHTELSGVTALDFMVEHLSASPLTDAARESLRPQVKELIEEPATSGFRIKLIV